MQLFLNKVDPLSDLPIPEGPQTPWEVDTDDLAVPPNSSAILQQSNYQPGYRGRCPIESMGKSQWARLFIVSLVRLV